jgi:hypothetical protein
VNLRAPSMGPEQLTAWWPAAEAVLEKRGRRGIAMTQEAYREVARQTEREHQVTKFSRWGFRP